MGAGSSRYFIYDYERFADHPAGKGLMGYHFHPLATHDAAPIAHTKIEIEGRANYYRLDDIAVDEAIDRFFTGDAEGAPFSASGLTPLR